MEDDANIFNLGVMFLLLLSILVSTYFVFLLGSVKENLESAGLFESQPHLPKELPTFTL